MKRRRSVRRRIRRPPIAIQRQIRREVNQERDALIRIGGELGLNRSAAEVRDLMADHERRADAHRICARILADLLGAMGELRSIYESEG